MQNYVIKELKTLRMMIDPRQTGCNRAQNNFQITENQETPL